MSDRDALFARIKAQLTKTLGGYRCCRNQDENGDGLQLVDVLTPGRSADIGPGKEEMESLIDDLTWDLGNALGEKEGKP